MPKYSLREVVVKYNPFVFCEHISRERLISVPLNKHELASLFALAWLGADCALSYSWYIFSYDVGLSRNWHYAFIFPFIGLGCWVFYAFWSGHHRTAMTGFVVTVFLGMFCWAQLDLVNFEMAREDRPLKAVQLINLGIAASFLLAYLSTPAYKTVCTMILAIGFFWSLFGVLEYSFCDPAFLIMAPDSICVGLVSEEDRKVLFCFLGALLLLCAGRVVEDLYCGRKRSAGIRL